MSDIISAALSNLYTLLQSGENEAIAQIALDTLTTEQAALVAIAARQRRLELEKEAEAIILPMKAVQELVERRFLSEMNATGETNKSGAGWRATKTTQFNATMPDAAAFYTWLVTSQRYDMLQRRLSSSVVQDFFANTGTLPPGIDMQPVNKVTFYRK